jgi:endonuclease/exonuclease/phosphatase family metal-dependent hydrolase
VTGRLRVVTYNVHKCRGMDGRVRPERIAEVLGKLDADVIALQEVMGEGGPPQCDQGRIIARELALEHYHFGENRLHRGSAYGNVVLSRRPLRHTYNYNITVEAREPRGCLRTDVEVQSERLLHLFNVHLGTAFMERRHQARKLLSADILQHESLAGPRLVVGDFNEWTRGLATRMLSEQFRTIDLRQYARRTRTYPGLLPVLHLDNLYFDAALKLEHFTIDRSRLALVASDHLPLVADFRLQ